MRALRRPLTLYVRLLTVQIKAILEYQSDFWVMTFGAALANATGFIFLKVVFDRFPDIHGWSQWEVVIIYALVFFAEGVGSLFFEGTWRLARLVNRGELDFALVRPVSPISQVMAGDVGMNGAGNIVLGGILIGLGLYHLQLHWTPALVFMAILMLISACAIKVAVNLASNSAAFWFQGGFNPLAFSIHQMGDMARYPLQIYSLGVKVALSVAIPFAFISFFPATALFSDSSWHWVGFLTPLVAAYCVAMAVLIFRRGLRRYESAGN